MKISQRYALLPLLALALAFTGCGGSDDNDGGPATNAFQGQYSGTYVSSLEDNGDISVVIGADGTVDASVASLATPTLAGRVAGSITNGGVFTGTLTYGTTAYTATGSLARDSGGRITGTLTQTAGSTTATITITIDISPSTAM